MRQSSAEIDHAILDVAAGIFATYGFQHASVQQIADAVGYSKPGLLHRFGSKEALHRAVLREVSETVQEIAGHALSLHEHPDQIPQVLELITRKALARPGHGADDARGVRPGQRGARCRDDAGRGLPARRRPGPSAQHAHAPVAHRRSRSSSS